MGMMIVDEDEFDNQVENTGNNKSIPAASRATSDVPTAIVEDLSIGRGIGSVEVPDILRKVIGEEAIYSSNKEVADAFGVSQSAVSAYRHGSNSTSSYNDRDPSLANHTDDVKIRASKRATNRMMMAMKHITTEKLEQASVKTLAGVAQAMAAVVKNMEPPQAVGPANGVQFVFYAPHMKTEKDFDVIDVTD